MLKIMTPGPTQVRENVRMKRSLETTNPDLDLEFYDFYKDTCDKLSKILKTDNASYILSGEAILGLEAACASLTEDGDRVLVIDNGIFGRGFEDFVKMYGAEAVIFESEYDRPVDLDQLAAFLEKDSDFKYATVVHCDTPSGVLNDIEKICRLLDSYGILSVVDSVSSMFAEAIDVEAGRIDIICGGSQKALSAPVGITLLCVSERAFRAMEERKSPARAFYCNLLNYRDYYINKWFPYSMPISDIYGVAQALDNVIEEEGFVSRHKAIAEATRSALTEAGLELYLKHGFSDTVTAVKVPHGLKDSDILRLMKEKHGIMIAGCFGCLAGKVIRIGHMGENANISDMELVMDALQGSLEELGLELSCNMRQNFLRFF